VEKKEDKKKGHGRNGIDKYPGANVIPPNYAESLKSGDPCPECPTGKVYRQKPGIIVFIKGNKLILYVCNAKRGNEFRLLFVKKN